MNQRHFSISAFEGLLQMKVTFSMVYTGRGGVTAKQLSMKNQLTKRSPFRAAWLGCSFVRLAEAHAQTEIEIVVEPNAGEARSTDLTVASSTTETKSSTAPPQLQPAPDASASPHSLLSSPITTVSPPPIDEVTVSGARMRRTPGSAHVVNNKTLERFGFDDPHAAVQLVPGVYVRQEDGLGLRPNIGIRGAAADRSKKVTLLEDGVPFAPAPYSAPAAYYFPMFPRVYQMRVIKGPAAISYGPQTVGGAVNLLTRPIPASLQGAVDLGLGDFGYGKFHGHVGSSDDRSGFLIEGAHLRSDGFKELPSGADTGFYRNEWMFKGVYRLDPTSPRLHDVALKLNYGEELSNETYLGLTDTDFRKNPYARYGASALDQMRWHRTSVAAVHRYAPSAAMKITTTAYRNDLSRIWRKVNGFRGAALFDVLRHAETAANAPFHAVLTGQQDAASSNNAILIGPNQRNFVSQGLMTQIEMRADWGPIRHALEYGIRVHYDRVERRHSEDAFYYVNGTLLPEATPTLVTAFNEASTLAASIHVLDAATWGRLTVTPGIRIEASHGSFLDRTNGQRRGGSSQVVLPGLGTYVAITDELGVLAGVHRGMSPPPPEHDIKPELSLNYEAGLRYSRAQARAELLGYYDDYTNLTSICTFSTGCSSTDLDRQFAAGRARIYGLEGFVEHAIAAGPISLPIRGAYTLTFTELRDAFQSPDPTLQSEDTLSGEVRPGDKMAYVPTHQAFASAGIEGRLAGGYLSANYVSKMREFVGSKPLNEALTTDAQFTADAGAHVRPFEWLKIYVTMRNLFDQAFIVSRRPFGARPNAPRWVQVGAKVTF